MLLTGKLNGPGVLTSEPNPKSQREKPMAIFIVSSRVSKSNWAHLAAIIAWLPGEMPQRYVWAILVLIVIGQVRDPGRGAYGN